MDNQDQTKETPELLKSGPLLRDFIKYCGDHPDERFWQALRNWSGAEAIYKQVPAGQGQRVIYEDMPVYIKDAFYDDK